MDLAGMSSSGRAEKRQKLNPSSEMRDKTIEIISANQLQQLLRFQQDLVSLKQALRSFKVFLRSIRDNDGDQKEESNRLAILLDYLNAQQANCKEDTDDAFLPDVTQAWSYASQLNDDSLLSAVPEALSLLLNIMSTRIQFRQFGLQLCKSILLTAPLKVLARGLSASQAKERIISPCLELITEVVSFDGGALAKKVYGLREFTFKGLARNLGLSGIISAGSAAAHQRETVRSKGLRYLTANFKYQAPNEKVDLLGQRDVVSACLKQLRQDPPEILQILLGVLKDVLITDKSIHQRHKRMFLTEWTLGRIATLYGYDTRSEAGNSIRLQAHELLSHICTMAKGGVLLPRTGWHSSLKQKTGKADLLEDQTFELGIHDMGIYHRPREGVRIRNSRLAAFIQTLRPYSDVLQSELVIKVFKAAPELVADYFAKTTHFSFDPKLTSTWVGYCSFLFSVIQLPIPLSDLTSEGLPDRPPPVQIVIESILPQTLNQKVLTRCLNQKSSLISLLTMRLITLAFQKLKNVLEAFLADSGSPRMSWKQASLEVTREFCRRCPKMKDVIALFRSIPRHHVLQREAITRLLVMYYRLSPQVALEEKFDMSIALSDSLHHAGQSDSSVSHKGMRLLELEHLLAVAQCTSDMRWTHRHGQLKLSLFTTILKLHVELSESPLRARLKMLLNVVNQEAQLVQEQTPLSALDALIVSLRRTAESKPVISVYEYLDNCVGRLAQRPVYYEDLLLTKVTKIAAKRSSEERGPLSLLVVVLIEQWPFLVENKSVPLFDKFKIAEFLATFLRLCRHIGENEVIIEELVQALKEAPENDEFGDTFRAALGKDNTDDFPAVELAKVSSQPEPTTVDHPSAKRTPSPCEPEKEEESAQKIEESKALLKWARKDVQDAVEDGDIGNLVLCLCSKHQGVRLQALAALSRFVHKVENSSYPEKELITLLLQETIHTAKKVITDEPFPTYLGAFAARALVVEADPQHFIYAKLNQFLHRGPIWDIGSVPLMHKILLHPPEEDGAHGPELEWFLDLALEGLQTQGDLNIYRRRNIFERCFSLYLSPHTLPRLRKKILSLIGCATTVEGGSTTLITRAGILSWIESQLELGDADDVTLKRLAARLLETCDQDRVLSWSQGATGDYLASL